MSKSYANIATGLFNALASSRGVDAVYRRDELECDVTVVPGSTRVELADETGAAIRTTSADFLLKAGELVLGGVSVEPQTGDRIVIVAADGSRQTWEIQPLVGESFRWSDSARLTARVHCRLIEEAGL